MTRVYYPTTTSDAIDLTTTSNYNAFNELLTQATPLTLNTDGSIAYATTKNYYDSAGNLKAAYDADGNETQYSYNPDGTVSSTTDAIGSVSGARSATVTAHTTNYGYDSYGDLNSVFDGNNHETQFGYDIMGNKTSQTTTRTDAKTGQTDTLLTQFSYDAENRLTETEAPDGSTAQTYYNDIGKVDHTIDAMGRWTQNTYNALGQLTQTSYPDGTSSYEDYDPDGNVLDSYDRQGHKTTTVYDSLERSVGSIAYGDGTGTAATTSETLDDDGETLTDTDANDYTTSYVYDDLGRKTDTYDAMPVSNGTGVPTGNHIDHAVYDLADRVLSSTDANNNTTSYLYDSNGNVLTTTYQDGTTSSATYDPDGRRITSTDQNDQTTTDVYDNLGRLSQVITPYAAANHFISETYTYDELGEKIGQTDANNHTTSFAYDLKGHVIQKSLPAGQSMSDAYNPDGSLEYETDYNGATTWMDYDSAGRLIDKRWEASGDPTSAASAAIVFSSVYNANGTLASKTKDSVTTSYAYDFMGRTASVTESNTGAGGLATTVSYSYDAASNKKTQETGSGTLTYDYDPDERLSAVHFAAGEDETGATARADYGYDPAGNRLTLARANGITTTYSYDTLNRLTNLVNATASTGAVVSSYGYQLNPNGQRRSVTDQTGAVTTYLYDLDSRLYDENGPYTGHIQYQYDNVGNRQYKWVNAAQTEAFVYDADDRVVTEQLGINTPVTFSYDANGNVLTDATNQYTWDWENKLTSSGPIGGSPTASDYIYDADGLRVQQTTPAGTTNYTIDPDSGFGDTIEDRDASGNLQARYDYGQGDLIDMQRSAGTSWYLFDGHGSTMQLTSTAGAVTDSYEYDAFGDLLTRTGTTPNVYLYDAQCADSTGLYYLRARYMDPSRGEFLGQDPFGGDDEDPVTLHRYLYAGDDGEDGEDPGGEDFGDLDVGSLNSIDSAAMAYTSVLVSSSILISLIEGTSRGDYPVPLATRVQLRNWYESGNLASNRPLESATFPYVWQINDGWCGRASQAMVIQFYTGVSISLAEWRLSVSTVSGMTGLPFKEIGGKDLSRAIESIRSGYPAIIYTIGIYHSTHIFVLTGYDPSTDTFRVNNTFGSSPVGMTSMNGHRLTRSYLQAHMHSQGSGDLIYLPANP